MLSRPNLSSRFATMRHIATSAEGPTLTQVLAAAGLVAVGIAIGARLVPVIRQWNEERGLETRRAAPIQEIDRWANEGGAVAPPAFHRVT